MNNELFVSLYDSLSRKLAFDISDAAAMRSVRIVRNALGQNRAPAILVETVTRGSAMYDVYYPLDEKSCRDALPRHVITRFNQQNLFNNQAESRHKRQFTGELDRQDGICCLHGCMTLVVPSEDAREESRLFYFMDVFASCLGLRLRPVNLEWYTPEQLTNEGNQGNER